MFASSEEKLAEIKKREVQFNEKAEEYKELKFTIDGKVKEREELVNTLNVEAKATNEKMLGLTKSGDEAKSQMKAAQDEHHKAIEAL